MHAYPQNLAARLLQLWDQKDTPDPLFQLPAYETRDALLPKAALEQLLSTCYQASLMREEDRPVRFRLVVTDPDQIGVGDAGPFAPLQRLAFEQPVAFRANELRRLAPAADFEQVLIGVRLNREQQLEIWGLVHSGSDWIRALEGSRLSLPLLPPSLVIGVLGPGHLAACRGSRLVVRLLAGQLSTPGDSLLFSNKDQADDKVQAQLLAQHEKARRQAAGPWAQIDPDLIRIIRRTLALRTINAIRKIRQGGTLLFLPRRLIRRAQTLNRYLRIKYPFAPTESTRTFHLGLIRLMNVLAESCGRQFGPNKVVGWGDYLSSSDPAVVESDRILSDISRLIASASAVDGAVVLGVPSEFVGFGAEILGPSSQVELVARALNHDGSASELESTSGVGTRHRSVYRLCQAVRETIAVVVSQDGEVRIVRNLGGQVTYWEQPSFGTMMV